MNSVLKHSNKEQTYSNIHIKKNEYSYGDILAVPHTASRQISQETSAKEELLRVSYSREEVSDSHRSGDSVSSLHSAMFAESDVESLVNEGLVYIVVIWQQGLIELALISEDNRSVQPSSAIHCDKQLAFQTVKGNHSSGHTGNLY